MPKYTNKHGAPDALFRLLGRESYSRGDSVKSVSQLIGAPRVDILKRKHADKIETDISDRIWALFGTAVHKLIEEGTPHSADEIVEERIFAEVEGWKISGAIDRRIMADGKVKLLDWKVTRVWSVMGPPKPEWEAQLNAYAELVEMSTGREVDSLEVGALLRDWSRAEGSRKAEYPPSPIHVVPIPLWPKAQRTAYLKERVRLHQEAEMDEALGEPLRECTDTEMWVIPGKWELSRPGGLRSYRVFNTEDEGVRFKETMTGGHEYTIKERPGRRVRCEVCEVAKWCDQYQTYLQDQKEKA